jgi:hypothetical protein
MNRMNWIRVAALVVLGWCAAGSLPAQPGHDPDPPFALSLQAVSVPGLPGLQSYTWGRQGDTWLLFGGRLDGLHRRQPWASFDLPGHNTYLYAVDIRSGQVWSRTLDELPAPIAEQMSSTNMAFQQRGDMLYALGGYGYSASQDDHITHPALLALRVPALIDALQNGGALAPHIRQLPDEAFAVTGGHLAELHGLWMVVGGQRFDGLYNPMGHSTHVQTYTDAVGRFRLADDGVNLSVRHLPRLLDPELFHRRDYNLMPSIDPLGRARLTAFSGVFQRDADLPFLNIVDIDTASWDERPGFSQYLNHYHCARAALYQPLSQRMHHVFFGGIAQFTLNSEGDLIQDADVPFVRTIARVTQEADGSTAEFRLPVDMPGLLGAGAEFIPAAGLAQAGPGILDLDALLGSLGSADSVLLGHLFGGISSPQPNVFWIEDGTLSSAYSQVLAVWLRQPGITGLDLLNAQSRDGLRLQVYPNPGDGNFTAAFELEADAEVSLNLYSPEGQLLWQKEVEKLKAGRHVLPISVPAQRHALTIVELNAGGRKTVQVVVAEP